MPRPRWPAVTKKDGGVRPVRRGAITGGLRSRRRPPRSSSGRAACTRRTGRLPRSFPGHRRMLEWFGGRSSTEGGRWRPEMRAKARFPTSLREMGEGVSIRGERRSPGKKKEGRRSSTFLYRRGGGLVGFSTGAGEEKAEESRGFARERLRGSRRPREAGASW